MGSGGLLLLACIPSGLYMFNRRSVPLSNVIGMSFVHTALSLLKRSSGTLVKTGTILLSGLFVYDIWWVFGTEVVSGV
jgi:minor histocompatibility antigen H13